MVVAEGDTKKLNQQRLILFSLILVNGKSIQCFDN